MRIAGQKMRIAECGSRIADLGIALFFFQSRTLSVTHVLNRKALLMSDHAFTFRDPHFLPRISSKRCPHKFH